MKTLVTLGLGLPGVAKVIAYFVPQIEGGQSGIGALPIERVWPLSMFFAVAGVLMVE